MKAFADLYAALDETTRTGAKVRALARYFAQAPPADAAWALYFLSGRKPRQVVPTRKLAAWATEAAGLSEWLFDESYHAVGDLGETIALLLPPPVASSALPLHEWVEGRLLPLRGADEVAQQAALRGAWQELDSRQRFVWNKLITGAFRVGVSQQLVTRALAEASGVDAAVLAHRLMGSWEPTAAFYTALLDRGTGDADHSRPYPFFLATPLEAGPEGLGPCADWQAEWKWDGIRAQLIRRAGHTFLWSRGEELLTERFPELADLGRLLPDGTVIDGEVLPWRDGAVQPFAQLQRRIGRKALGKKILAEVPVVLMAYDLLEQGGADLRERPLAERRQQLAALVTATPSDGRLLLSPPVPFASWEESAAARADSRNRHVEGLMLKRLSSPYRVGTAALPWHRAGIIPEYSWPGSQQGGRAMPIHDWTRVHAGIFHDFHLAWIGEIRRALNSGLLPPDYYALAEQIAGGMGPDVLALRAPVPGGNSPVPELEGAVAVSLAPPKVRLTVKAEIDAYTLRRRTVVIRHVSGHRVVALIETLSPGNKASRHALRSFLDKAASALAHGIHLLRIDLFPPGPRDPQGLHGALWEQLTGDPHAQPADQPLTLAAYVAGPVPTAYVEPVAVGAALPDMPLFLDPEQYINVPLEATYRAAYEGVPRYYRAILEAPGA
jgi:DNA ligase-1